jgi:DNA-binding CsgD family transcriptional regulator
VLASLRRNDAQVIDYVTRGLTNGEISALLGISRHTVRNHLARLFRELGVSTRAALTALVLE